MSDTIGYLADSANGLTEDAGIEITDLNEVTPLHVAEWLGVNLDEVGESMLVSMESFVYFLDCHKDWIESVLD